MPSPFPNLPPERRGTVHRLWFDSKALAGNPWGDPPARDLFVHVPRGCEGRPLPAILFLAPFSGTGEKLLARGLSEESLAARLDRLFAEGCPPFVSVMPDAMTSGSKGSRMSERCPSTSLSSGSVATSSMRLASYSSTPRYRMRPTHEWKHAGA